MTEKKIDSLPVSTQFKELLRQYGEFVYELAFLSKHRLPIIFANSKRPDMIALFRELDNWTYFSIVADIDKEEDDVKSNLPYPSLLIGTKEAKYCKFRDIAADGVWKWHNWLTDEDNEEGRYYKLDFKYVSPEQCGRYIEFLKGRPDPRQIFRPCEIFVDDMWDCSAEYCYSISPKLAFRKLKNVDYLVLDFSNGIIVNLDSIVENVTNNSLFKALVYIDLSVNQIPGLKESKVNILKLLEFVSKNNGVLNICNNECSNDDCFMHDLVRDLPRPELIQSLIWENKYSIESTKVWKKQIPTSMRNMVYENHHQFYERMHALIHDSAIWNKLKLLQ